MPLDDIEIVPDRSRGRGRGGLVEDPPQGLGADLNRHVGELVEQVRIGCGPLGLRAAPLRRELRERPHEPSLFTHQAHHHDVVVFDALEAQHGPIRAVRQQARAKLLDGDGTVRSSRGLTEALHEGSGKAAKRVRHRRPAAARLSSRSSGNASARASRSAS
jgi:hypothetical protein